MISVANVKCFVIIMTLPFGTRADIGNSCISINNLY